ncbi:DUF6538 domain-containing protein [Kiloniella sp.]|uniref:DUF6538 domain-containing protein n=1 Tax=Kiloniella sp. TaxID=1938587 RepID=UPI003A8F3498
MPKIPELFKRGSVYYFRRRVPSDLFAMDILEGKKEIKESLKTTNYIEAKKRRNERALYWDAAFNKFRESSSFKKTYSTLSSELATALVQEYIKRRGDEWKKDFETTKPDDDLLDELRKENVSSLTILKSFEDPRKDQSIGLIAKKLLGSSKTEIMEENYSYSQFSSLIQRGLIELHRRYQAMLDNDYTNSHFDHLFDPEKPVALPVTFGELTEEYKQEYSKISKGKSDRAPEKIASEIKLILQIISPETLVSSINHDVCIVFRDKMNCIPKNKTKIYGDMPLDDAISLAEDQGKPTMAYDTQTAYFRTFKNIIKLAVKKSLLLTDPSLDLMPLAEKIPDSEKRKSFTSEQLQQIFTAPIYTGCKDDFMGFSKPGTKVIKKARYWGPLIFLFSGLRPNEFCSLLLTDVKRTKAGTYYFSITAGKDGKKLKTITSTRTPPVHPELIKFGFLEYVEDLINKGETRLFPELNVDKRGYYSKDLSDWFSDSFLKNTITGKDRQSFYSFRHNFRNALRHADAPDWVLQALGAWDKKKTVSDNYGEHEWPDHLRKWIEKVNYPDLDLSHLYIK